MTKDHIIWIREGTWRVLACYDTAAEAKESLRRLRYAGDTVRYVVRGSCADESFRANVHQAAAAQPPGQEG